MCSQRRVTHSLIALPPTGTKASSRQRFHIVDRPEFIQQPENSAMRHRINLYHFVFVCTALLTTAARNAPAQEQPKEKNTKRQYPTRPYYESGKWDPTVFFTDSLAIKCASAIARNDTTSVDELIAEGLDVNHRGKHDCTLLLWAYSSPKIEIFRALLEAGADPNIPLTAFLDDTTSGYPDLLIPGKSVTSICSTSGPSETWFNLVFKHGGDPNFTIAGKVTDDNVLLRICTSNLTDTVCQRRTRVLCKLGAKPNFRPKNCRSPLSAAIGSANYGTAIELIENGADIWLPVKEDCDHIVPMHTLAEVILESANLYGTIAGSRVEFPCKWVKNPNPNFHPLIETFIKKGLHGQAFRRALRDAAVSKTWSKHSSTVYWEFLPLIHKLEDESLGIMHPRPDWLRPLTEDERRQKESTEFSFPDKKSKAEMDRP